MRRRQHQRRKVHRPKHSAQVRLWIERAKTTLNAVPKPAKSNLYQPEHDRIKREQEANNSRGYRRRRQY